MNIKQSLDEITALAKELPQPYKDRLLQQRFKISFAILKSFSQLEDGLVRAGDVCPFVAQCQLKDGCSKIEATPQQFSCGAARAFDLIHSTKQAKVLMEKSV